MKKIVAFALALLLLCGSAVSEELAKANRESTAPASLLVENDGAYVGENGDLKPGWYSVTPVEGELSKITVVDAETFEEPKIIYSIAWFEDGAPFVSFSDDQPEQYTIPLWEGCFVLPAYYGDMSYNSNAGTLDWSQSEEVTGVNLTYLAPLSGEISSLGVSKGIAVSESKKDDALLLYEDDAVRITYSDFHVESFKNGSSYIKTEWLIENKTDEIIDVTCDSITVNGCAVHISKFADVPPNSKYLNEWTNSAEQFLKFGIDEVKTFSAVLTINNGKKIQSYEITLE